MREKEKTIFFLNAFEWAEKRNFVNEDKSKMLGFCSIIVSYLESYPEKEAIYLREITSVMKHRPQKTYNELFWFKPVEWKERKKIYLKVKKEYEQQNTNFMKKLWRKFWIGDKNNPIPIWVYLVIFAVTVATVLMLMDVVFSLME